jgi:hypothetical protein
MKYEDHLSMNTHCKVDFSRRGIWKTTHLVISGTALLSFVAGAFLAACVCRPKPVEASTNRVF